MTKENLKLSYRNLGLQVLSSLRDKIENSDYISKHINQKAIEVNLFDYKELSIIDGRLTFLSENGLQFSLFAEANLDDLIDILNKI